MGCTVTTNRHGVLTFRIFWQGGEYWRSTGRKDTPEDRHYVEALAEVISDNGRLFPLDPLKVIAADRLRIRLLLLGFVFEPIETERFLLNRVAGTPSSLLV